MISHNYFRTLAQPLEPVATYISSPFQYRYRYSLRDVELIPPPPARSSAFCQAYHDLWIGLLLATHIRFVLINTTTYESIKGRHWVDNSTHGRPFYVRYPLNCYRFFFRPAGGENVTMGNYGRLPTQVMN